MAEVDPNAPLDETLPAGEYLLAMTWFVERQSPRTKGFYWRMRYEVILPEYDPARSFFATMPQQLNSAGARIRWHQWARAADIDQRFRPEREAHVRRLFLGKPFRAAVTREQKGFPGRQYLANDIGRYLIDIDEATRKVAEAWANKFLERGLEGPGGYSFPADGDR